MAGGSGRCGRPGDRDAVVPLVGDQFVGQTLVRCAHRPDGEVRAEASVLIAVLLFR